MHPFPVFAVSGSSNDHRALVLRENCDAGVFTNQQWGKKLTPIWRTPDFVAAPKTEALPAASITSAYLPGLLVATAEAATKVRDPMIEELPARIEGRPATVMNAQFTIHRFREEGADALRVPGAVLLLRSADFFAEDIPAGVHLFWLHDGNFPRFLLCTERFVRQVRQAKLSGLTFTQLGYAKTDA